MLWDFEVLMRRSLTATLTKLKALRPGVRTDDLDIESVVADREAAAEELRGSQANLERIRLAAFSRTLSRLGLPDDDLAGQLNAYYLQHRFDNVELFPEVVDAPPKSDETRLPFSLSKTGFRSVSLPG